MSGLPERHAKCSKSGPIEDKCRITNLSSIEPALIVHTKIGPLNFSQDSQGLYCPYW